MAKKKYETKPLDITQVGALNWRDLQAQNAYKPGEVMLFNDANKYFNDGRTPTMGSALEAVKAYNTQWEGFDEQSPIYRNSKGEDYYGNSFFDKDILTDAEWQLMQTNANELRAREQPWYSKLTNGIGKAGILAATTALETAGLIYGLGQGAVDAYNAEDGEGGKAFLHGLWNNPITQALQKVNEASEEYMPNYYTQEEQEGAFHIFTANFLGDKLIKNLGFMVGAFYGGMPAAWGIGKLGTAAVKSARNIQLAERMGMAKRVKDIYREGNKMADAAERQLFIDSKLTAEGLTEAERGIKLKKGMDKINKIANTTRATTQTVGVIGSAINEGAIEAINNSKDWADARKLQAEDLYQQKLAEIDARYDGIETDGAIREKMEAAEDHERRLAEIEKGRAEVGNADLLMNLPILLASNAYQLSKLYTRGFDSTRRQMGSVLNGHKLSGDLAKGTLKTDRTKTKAALSALYKSNTEGVEELTQRMASDASGYSVDAAIDRYMRTGKSEDSKTNVDDYIAGIGKSIAENLQNPQAWEEYFIGAVSSIVGMPVFGAQTKNAYAKLGPIGFQGGFIGNYSEYTDAMKKEHDIAEYLNGRVKDPKFKKLYDYLRKSDDYESLLRDALANGDKEEYKDLEAEKLFADINAAASSGHLEEFKQLVGYNHDYDDAELADIVKQTSREISPEVQQKQDENRKAVLEARIEELSKSSRAITPEEEKLFKELEEVNKRLKDNETGENKYETKLEGPFIDINGQMNVTNPEKMREILERNRQNLLKGIDDYLKIRNDIDIETDGRLEDKDINFLTNLRFKIQDLDNRSSEMAEDLVSTLPEIAVLQEKLKTINETRKKTAQTEYDNAVSHLEKAKQGKQSKEYLAKLEEKLERTKENLKVANRLEKENQDALDLLGMLTEQKETTRSERKALDRGYGQDESGKFYSNTHDVSKRNINSDEVQNILLHPQNTRSLLKIIKSAGLDAKDTQRLVSETIALSMLAYDKQEYRKKVREFLKDPSLINEGFKQSEDKLSQEQKNNKVSDLALKISKVNSMAELDSLMKDSRINPEIMSDAFQKAKQDSDDGHKNLFNDYETGYDFMSKLHEQTRKLPEEVRAGVLSTLQNEWDTAMEGGLNIKDSLKNGLNESIKVLEDAGKKEEADAIRQILKDLNVSEKSSATNSKVKQEKDNNKKKRVTADGGEEAADKKDKDDLAALSKAFGKKDSTPDTQESLVTAIKEELKADRKRKITKLGDLSKGLRDRIDKYNEDTSHDPIDGAFVKDLIQAENDARDIEENSFDEEYSGEEFEETRAEEMSKDLKVSFKSDGVATEFLIYIDDYLLEYTLPYDTSGDPRATATQEILRKYLAYQFVNKNYLGYIAEGMHEMPKVHLLRSTDPVLNEKGNEVTFLAIEITDKARKSIQNFGFNGKNVNLDGEINPITIDGKQYQIVGTLSINSDTAGIDKNIAIAFGALQSRITSDLHDKMKKEQEKEKPQPFILSNRTVEINHIYTGRLEKYNDSNDGIDTNKISLHSFLTNPQGKSRRVSTEFANGGDVYFAVIVNRSMKTALDGTSEADRLVPNSTEWAAHNNGAIEMLVPKPDGKLYPVRCTRRTVGQWLTSDDIDREHTGRSLLEAVMASENPIHNEYLENIISDIETLINEKASFAEKLEAKNSLAKYFVFGEKRPIHIDSATNGITLDYGDGKGSKDLDSGDSLQTNVMKVFDFLAEHNVKFSLPSPSLEKVNGRDVVMAGVFEIGMRGYYNFNANFSIKPVDGNGNPVSPASSPKAGDSVGNHMRGGNRDLIIVEGNKYHFEYDDGELVVTDSKGNTVDSDTFNLVAGYIGIADNSPSCVYTLLDKAKYAESSKKVIIPEMAEKYRKVYTIESNGVIWVIDKRDTEAKIYRLDSKQGVGLYNAFKTEAAEIAAKNRKKIQNADSAAKAAGAITDKITTVINSLFDAVISSGKELGKAPEEFSKIDKKALILKLQKITKGKDRADVRRQVEKAFEGIGLAQYWANIDAFDESTDKVGVKGRDIIEAVISNIIMTPDTSKPLSEYTFSDFIDDAREVFPRINWDTISKEINNIKTIAKATAQKQILGILSKYLSKTEIASMVGDVLPYTWVSEVANLLIKNPSASTNTSFPGITLNNLQAHAGDSKLLTSLSNLATVKQAQKFCEEFLALGLGIRSEDEGIEYLNKIQAAFKKNNKKEAKSLISGFYTWAGHCK